MKTAQKIRGRQGVAAAVVVLAILVLILLAAVSFPVYRAYRFETQKIGCVSALKSANDQLSIETIARETPTAKEARAIVTRAMNGWDDLCPGGGTPYLIENDGEGAPWRVVCGLHDTDTRRRTRLNAANALSQIQEKVADAERLGEPEPATVTVVLNGQALEALLTEQETGLRRGTGLTSGVEGTVIHYALAGSGDFAGDLPAGSVCYFSYADEEHCAAWSSREGWTGDSYE